jgi:Flp pilus assembly protein TadG
MTSGRPYTSRRIRRVLAQTSGFLRGRKSEKGVAATEFALILPVGMLLFTGILTFGTVNELNHKVTLSARTITDLVAQCSALDTADMNQLLLATAAVMYPFSPANLTMTVSQIAVQPNGGSAAISWSAALSGSGYTPGQNVTLPSGMVSGNTSTTYILWGHASYPYAPTIGYMVTSILGPITLSDDFYMYPRNVPAPGSITYSSTATTACD